MYINQINPSYFVEPANNQKPSAPAPGKIDCPVVLEYAKKHFPKEGILRVSPSGLVSIEFSDVEYKRVLTQMASDLKDYLQDQKIYPDAERPMFTMGQEIDPETAKRLMPFNDRKVHITVLDMHREVSDSPHWLSVSYILQVRSPEIEDLTFPVQIAWWWWHTAEPSPDDQD